MYKCVQIAFGSTVICAVAGCKDIQKGQSAQQPAQQESEAAIIDTSRKDFLDVMQAKQTFASSLIGSMASANFESIELDAMQLSWLSQRAEWLAHDTAEYRGFSDRFRQIADEMAIHAQQRNLTAVVKDYSNLTASCIECHTYLRSEGLVQDVPGMPD
jgi:hypothetical protein